MRDFVKFLRFFYGLVGFNLVVLVLFMVGAALTEVLATSMFMPLLEQNDIDNEMARIIARVFDAIGIPYTFTIVLVIMVTLFFVRSAFLIVKTMYVARLVSHLLVDIRSNLVDRLFKAKYEYFLRKDVGYLNNAVVVEYSRVAFAFEQLASVVVGIVFAAIYLAIPLVLNPLILGIIAVMGVPGIFVVRKINAETRKYSLQNSAQSATLQELLIQALRNYKYLKATYSYEKLLGRVHKAARQLGTVLYRLWVLAGISYYGFAPFSVLGVAILLYYLVEIRQVQIVDTLFVLYLLQRAFGKIIGIQYNYRKFLSSFGGIKVLQLVEKEVAEAQEPVVSGGAYPDFAATINLDHVSFRFETGGDVLKDVSLQIAPNTTVALVGLSGAGKTTLATLLTGILRPTDGEISLGGRSYDDLDQKALRSGIGYVTQEGVIFNDSVWNNLTLWSDDASEEQVQDAARRAHIDEFIEQLPNGYRSTLGTDGLKVSGGQRQRINIARELLKDVKLLIFDEATSSLDSDSEREIQRNLSEYRGKKTIVLIAHRLSTVKNADVIFVLKDGRIVAQGDYDQVYRENGEFKRLVDLQMLSALSPEDNAPSRTLS